ncbi:MAG: hypothetical protein ACRC33_28210 [Gemmataceae bacterium]
MSTPQTNEARSPPMPLDARELQMNADYDWAQRDTEVQKTYAGRFAAVYQSRVWGAGRRPREAFEAAMRLPGCPGKMYLAMVYIEGVALPGGAK